MFVVREGLSNRVMWQRPQGNEGSRQVEIKRKGRLGEGNIGADASQSCATGKS